MQKLKVFTAGLLIGALVTGSIVGVRAAAENVTAVLGSYKIKIDGVTATLPDDQEILNYNGRIYTPARFVAEKLGAAVDWDDATKTVLIESPEPTVVEKIVEVEKEVVVEKATETAKSRFLTLPVRYDDGVAYFEVYGINRFDSETEFKIEVANNSASRYDINLMVDLEAEDEKGNELSAEYLDYLNRPIAPSGNFETWIYVERKKNAERYVKLTIPYTLTDLKTDKVTNHIITFYIDGETDTDND